MIRLLPGLLVLLLWLYCLVDVISARADGIRHLGKNIWLLIVLFFPFVGSLAWLIAGRPRAERPLTRAEGAAPDFPEYERRGRFAASDPEEDAEFLRKVRERAEEQRRRYEAQKRREREAQEPDPDSAADPDPA
ncbi:MULTISPECIES: PLD nuclease N-terminal domain-containing protein [Nocardioides]|uniref:PLD nuclease N-terminal domain-containing protein n=1 Tax=Nocardioides vastitatis TaxID=2568655 RepID=A0ABW0ZG27_9ACTN|nr:PLD nuclease N-terminal domain-containing protein [Nocardioides sp.]THJ02731.1 hypothetical protein E7Z54_10035 [Nocardioides sp.]